MIGHYENIFRLFCDIGLNSKTRIYFLERKDVQIILISLAKCNYQIVREGRRWVVGGGEGGGEKAGGGELGGGEKGRDGKGVGSEAGFFFFFFFIFFSLFCSIFYIDKNRLCLHR